MSKELIELKLPVGSGEVKFAIVDIDVSIAQEYVSVFEPIVEQETDSELILIYDKNNVDKWVSSVLKKSSGNYKLVAFIEDTSSDTEERIVKFISVYSFLLSNGEEECLAECVDEIKSQMLYGNVVEKQAKTNDMSQIVGILDNTNSTTICLIDADATHRLVTIPSTIEVVVDLTSDENKIYVANQSLIEVDSETGNTIVDSTIKNIEKIEYVKPTKGNI